MLTHGSQFTYRPIGLRISYAFMLVGSCTVGSLLIICLLLLLDSVSLSVVIGCLWCIFVAVTLWRSMTIAVRISDGVLVVRNLYRTVRVAPGVVTGYEWRKPFWCLSGERRIVLAMTPESRLVITATLMRSSFQHRLAALEEYLSQLITSDKQVTTEGSRPMAIRPFLIASGVIMFIVSALLSLEKPIPGIGASVLSVVVVAVAIWGKPKPTA